MACHTDQQSQLELKFSSFSLSSDHQFYLLNIIFLTKEDHLSNFILYKILLCNVLCISKILFKRTKILIKLKYFIKNYYFLNYPEARIKKLKL